MVVLAAANFLSSGSPCAEVRIEVHIPPYGSSLAEASIEAVLLPATASCHYFVEVYLVSESHTATFAAQLFEAAGTANMLALTLADQARRCFVLELLQIASEEVQSLRSGDSEHSPVCFASADDDEDRHQL